MYCSMSLGAEVSQAVVRDYLLHHGYADTLAAFDRSCACADEDGPKASVPSPSANGHRCRLPTSPEFLSIDAALSVRAAIWQQAGRLQAGRPGAEAVSAEDPACLLGATLVTFRRVSARL